MLFIYYYLSFNGFGTKSLIKEETLKIDISKINFTSNSGPNHPVREVESKLSEMKTLTKPEQAAIQKHILTLKKYMVKDKNELENIEKEITQIDKYLQQQPAYIAQIDPKELKKYKHMHIKILLKHLKYKKRKKIINYLKTLKLEKLEESVYILSSEEDYIIQEKKLQELQEEIDSLNK